MESGLGVGKSWKVLKNNKQNFERCRLPVVNLMTYHTCFCKINYVFCVLTIVSQNMLALHERRT